MINIYKIFSSSQVKLITSFRLLNPIVRFNNSNKTAAVNPVENQEYVNAIQEKVTALEQSQPFFDRLIFYDPDVMATLPKALDRLDPAVEFGKNIFVGIHEYIGIPWWGVLGLACIMTRTTLLPLIYLQMKRTSKLAAVIPALIQMKQLTDLAQCSKMKKLYYQIVVSYEIVRKQKLKFTRLMLYNIFHFPLLITTIWSIRRLLVEESLQQTSFLWVKSLSAIDPFYILPILTISCYYYNLQRFITVENKDSLPSRIRSFGQILLIAFLPFLCNWPSAIVLYMFYNALFSLIQTTMMIHPGFQKIVDPKMFLYQLIVRQAEYDTTQSKALVESIQSGEETLMDRAIEEEVLLKQMKEVLQNLNNEEAERHNKVEDLYNKF